MRFRRLLCLLIFVSAIAAVCAAQNQDEDQNQSKDTNFSSGPQYLANFGSPLFRQSISTPSLSLEPAVTAPAASESQPATTTEVEPVPAPAAVSHMRRIFYGGPTQSAPDAAIESVEAQQSGVEVNQIKTGEPNGSYVEISSATSSATIPASIFNDGVSEMLDTQSVHDRGYGMDLAESAAFFKTHKPHAARQYTNADVSRLHGG
jgi:hypothetical protein